MTRRKTPKAKTMKVLDAATMTMRTVHLYRTVFEMRDGSAHAVQHYAAGDDTAIDVANRLYAGKGAFGSAVSTERVYS